MWQNINKIDCDNIVTFIKKKRILGNIKATIIVIMLKNSQEY